MTLRYFRSHNTIQSPHYNAFVVSFNPSTPLVGSTPIVWGKPNPNMGVCPNAHEAWKEVSTISRFGLFSRFKWTLKNSGAFGRFRCEHFEFQANSNGETTKFFVFSVVVGSSFTLAATLQSLFGCGRCIILYIAETRFSRRMRWRLLYLGIS